MNDLVSVEIDWHDVVAEFGWIPITQGEGYTMTYIVKHPDIIAKGLELKGLETAIPGGVEKLTNGTPKKILFADAIFARGDHFYVVEAEETIKKKKIGEKEAKERAKALEELLERQGKKVQVTPVFVGIRYPTRDAYGYLVGVPLE